MFNIGLPNHEPILGHVKSPKISILGFLKIYIFISCLYKWIFYIAFHYAL